MDTRHASNYLENIKSLFRYYKSLGDRALAQIEEKEINYKLNDNDNSVAIIVKHIAGNMLSRWTNFLTEDGEKEMMSSKKPFILKLTYLKPGKKVGLVYSMPLIHSNQKAWIISFISAMKVIL